MNHVSTLRHRCARGISFGVLCLIAPIMLTAQPTALRNTLLPAPSSITAGTGSLAISKDFTVSLSGAHNPILEAATRRTLASLETNTGIPISKDDLQSPNPTLTIQVEDTTTALPTLETDETYSLSDTSSKIVLQAHTVFGALHGLETIQQLVQAEDGHYVIPAVEINDTPRFPWRGFMLDVSRHFMPLPVIYRTLDGMAAVKLNVFHWHLTDDQGFRIESKRFPLLTAKGSDGLFYTQDQVRDVIAYASARGIRVVPEFDIPGHVTSWLVGMPELGSVQRPYQISRTFGIWDGALDPTRDSTYNFLDAFIGEMAALFPDNYLHLGGDESNGADWKANPSIVAFMQAHNMKSTDELQTYFSTRVLALVNKHHKQMVGWDEILTPGTPKDAVIQSWRGVESLAVAAKQGNRGILSAPYYLDAMKTAERMYLDDPIPDNSTLTPDQQKLILGGEVCMWAEQITAQTVDSRVWPRTAALAERFWSPRQTRDIPDMYRRLAVESIRLDGLGLTHISGPESGLRQLAGSEAAASQLAILISTLSPVPFHERYHQQKTSQLTPMGNPVDYTRPDPPLREDLRLLVERYLHSTTPADHAAAHQQLQTLFQSWIASVPALSALAPEHPKLNQLTLRRSQLAQLGQLGIQSLASIESHTPPTSAWIEAQSTLLKTSADHSELTDFVILPPLQQLVDTAGKLSTIN
ncbi:beta-N-acetylhexosaminidase [Tunturibacter empetritectus]|uniref:Hexosaminidase n=1 Tax=Tunturiibacter empetritectus TaxID=3069691 RepID=A0A7W8IJQ3_9BACT|nr:beta-N-acetylhexosaminidase [Edaphobacter lichenicola]MBB5317468.1 hexosaminidase [Edaphobacter lichenicola]